MELLYQMQALQVIGILKGYDIKKIITTCPHCYNIFKNEYPDLGGNYEVINYLQLIDRYIVQGRLKINRQSIRRVGRYFP